MRIWLHSSTASFVTGFVRDKLRLRCNAPHSQVFFLVGFVPFATGPWPPLVSGPSPCRLHCNTLHSLHAARLDSEQVALSFGSTCSSVFMTGSFASGVTRKRLDSQQVSLLTGLVRKGLPSWQASFVSGRRPHSSRVNRDRPPGSIRK